MRIIKPDGDKVGGGESLVNSVTIIFSFFGELVAELFCHHVTISRNSYGDSFAEKFTHFTNVTTCFV